LNKFIVRIVSLILVPCLMGDPGTVSAFSISAVERSVCFPAQHVAPFQEQAFQLPEIWGVLHAFLYSGGRGARHEGSAVARKVAYAGVAALALYAITHPIDVQHALETLRSNWQIVANLLTPAGSAVAVAMVKPKKFPKVDPWKVATHVLDRERGIGTIVSRKGKTATVEFSKGTAAVSIKQLRPIFTLFELGIVLDVNAYTTLDPAMLNGWFYPDVPRSEGLVDQDYFFPENLDAFRDRFVLRYNRADVLDINELAKALGKLPVRIYDLIRVGRLTPVQTIWTGDIRGTPFFLRRDLDRFLEDFAPEKVPNAMRLDVLAKKIGRPERVVANAIADKRISPRAIGPTGYRHYIVTSTQIDKYKALLKPPKPPRDRSRLRTPKHLVIDQYQLAKALRRKGETRISEAVSSGEIVPIQSVWRGGMYVTHYFLRRKLETYKKILAPELLPDSYMLHELAKELEAPEGTVSGVIRDGIIQPPGVLGTVLKPVFIVPPEAMQEFKRILHPEKQRISLDALATEAGADTTVLEQIAHRLRIPIQGEYSGERIWRFVDLQYKETLLREVPPPAPKGMLTATDTEEKLGLSIGRLKGLPSDFQRPHGMTGLIHNYYREKGLPKGRAAVERWLDALEIRADPISRQSASDAKKSGTEPEREPPQAPKAKHVFRVDESLLKYPREELLSLFELAEELGKSRQRISDLVSKGLLKPVQTIWRSEVQGFHYFWQSELENYKRKLSPEKVENAYKLRALAQALKVSDRRLARAIAEKVIKIKRQNIIGYAARPAYIVSPEEMESFRRILHPELDRMSLFEASTELGVGLEIVERLAAEAGVKIKKKKEGNRTRRSFERAEFPKIKALLPATPGKNMIPLTRTAERLGVDPETLENTRPDGIVPHGTRDFRFFDENNFPNLRSRKAVWDWIRARRVSRSIQPSQRTPRVAVFALIVSLGGYLQNAGSGIGLHLMTIGVVGLMGYIWLALRRQWKSNREREDLSAAAHRRSRQTLRAA